MMSTTIAERIFSMRVVWKQLQRKLLKCHKVNPLFPLLCPLTVELFYIQCISQGHNAMWDSGILTKLQACGIFSHPKLKRGRKKKLNKHNSDVECEFLPSTHPPLLSPLLLFPDKEPLGVQKNIWKLVAQRVTQHFIKQGATPNHSPLFLSVTNDPEKTGSGLDLCCCDLFLISTLTIYNRSLLLT